MSRDIGLWGDQYPFVNDGTHHFTVIAGGVGSGKSLSGAVKGLLASQGRVGEVEIPIPNVGFVTAPTHTMLKDVTVRAYKDVADQIDVRIRKMNDSPPISCVLANGSEILFRSAELPNNLRGPNLAWWHGDEAAYYDHLVWQIMIGRLRQGGRFGWAWLTTTPKGQNWIYQEFIKAPIRPQYKAYFLQTLKSPFLDPDFKLALKESYSGDFSKQELEGAFVAFEGLVYPEFDVRNHVTEDIPDTRKFAYTVAGVDWGFVNPGVINIYGITGDDRAYLIHEEYKRQRGIDEWVNVAYQLRDIYQVRSWYCDPSEPDYISKFKAKGLKALAADNTVSTGIQTVKRRLAIRSDGIAGLLYYRGAVQNIAEKAQYQWAKKKDVMLDEPLKANDHTCDAERYAMMGIDNQKPLVATVRKWA